MNKTKTLAILIVLLLAFFPQACKKKETAVDKSQVLNLIPNGATAIFSIDTARIFNLQPMEGVLDEAFSSMHKGLEEIGAGGFFEATGIDLKKDLKRITSAVYAETGQGENILILAEMEADANRIVSFLQDRGTLAMDSEYRQTKIWSIKETETDFELLEKARQDMGLAFISPKLMAIGAVGTIKQVLDLQAGAGESVISTPGFKESLAGLKSDGLLWLTLPQIPKGDDQEEGQGFLPFMPQALNEAHGMQGYLDYRNKSYEFALHLLSKNPEANKELVEMLNGFKAMAAMGLTQDKEDGPLWKELLDRLQLEAKADRVSLSAVLPEALMKGLAEKASSKASEVLQGSAEPEEAEDQYQEI